MTTGTKDEFERAASDGFKTVWDRARELQARAAQLSVDARTAGNHDLGGAAKRVAREIAGGDASLNGEGLTVAEDGGLVERFAALSADVTGLRQECAAGAADEREGRMQNGLSRGEVHNLLRRVERNIVHEHTIGAIGESKPR